MKISDTSLFNSFKTTPPILPTAPYLWGKNLTPLPLFPLIKEEGGSNYALAFQVKKVAFID